MIAKWPALFFANLQRLELCDVEPVWVGLWQVCKGPLTPFPCPQVGKFSLYKNNYNKYQWVIITYSYRRWQKKVNFIQKFHYLWKTSDLYVSSSQIII